MVVREIPTFAMSTSEAPTWKNPAPNDWEDDSWEDVADSASGPTTPTTPPETLPITNGPVPELTVTPPPSMGTSEKTSNQSPTQRESPGNGSTTNENAIRTLQTERDAAQKRAKTIELKLFAVTRERDALRRGRDNRSADAELIKQKDEQIKAVLNEGEQLSIKISEKEMSLRQAKSKISELESLLESKNDDIAAAEAKVEAALTRERVADAALRAADGSRDAAEKRVRALEAGVSTASSAALDAVKAELENAKKAATDAVKATEARLRKLHVNELNDVNVKHGKELTALNTAIDELRARLVDDAAAAGAREDRLRRDVANLREHTSALEARAEELAAAVPYATRPLLRQIDALQAASAERARAASAAEKTLLERARDAETARAAAHEREKAAEERVAVLITRTAALQEQVKLAKLGVENAEEEIVRVREEAEKEIARVVANSKNESEKARMAVRERDEAKAELRKERENALDKSEESEKKEKELKDTIATLEAKLEMAREAATSEIEVPITPSRQSLQEIAALASGEVPISPGASTGSFVTEPNTGVYATERMAVILKQRTGEVESLQIRLREKENSTNALAEEVVELTKKLEELTNQIKDAPIIREKYFDLEKRHETLLELLGEREERISELTADLDDVRVIYKEQLNELMCRLEGAGKV